MKKAMLLVGLLALASCGTTTNAPGVHTGTDANTEVVSGAVQNPTVAYPTTQHDTPATQFCESHGGQVSVETENNVEVAYCTINGEKLDAWQFMSDATRETAPEAGTEAEAPGTLAE